MAAGPGGTGRWRTRGRWLVVVAVLGAVVSPAVRDRDSFPLSTYPMYAQARDRSAVFATVVGLDAGGRAHRLSLGLIADTDDPLIAQARVADAVADGRADALCRAVADRLAPDPARRELVTVAVVSERVDVVAVAADGAPPEERRVHTTCPVGR